MKQASKKARPKRRAEINPPLPSGRRWLFRLLALVILPVVALATLEIVLRLGGFGYATGFFERVRVGGKEYLANNENFSLRFFPPQLARWPGPVMMETPKPAHTYRIFILGESAARGEPQPRYAASRYLETLLDERFPGTHFEVVNLGITAINSHVILPIAEDCAKAGGDLWIVYMGNNEMVGPFGAATVFGAKAPPLGFVRLNLLIQKTRIGQLLIDLGRKLKGRGANDSWGGMKMFTGNQIRADDRRKEAVYRNFERNLHDILQAGLDSGAGVILNTVAVNLRDCPPFAALANSNLPAAEREQFEKLIAGGSSAEKQSNFVEAAREFEQAARLDPIHPEAQYRWAECLLAVSNFAGAREHFQKACDTDALPFRADSRINGAIKKVALDFANQKLACLDAAEILTAKVESGICGQETFYEHVHFNFDGNFRLGRAWAEQVEKLLPGDIARRASSNGWLAQEACDRRLALTDWNRCAVTEMMIDRLQHPPLSGQSNNAKRTQRLENELDESRQRMNPASAQAAEETYRAAINRAPQDYELHENFAEFLESTGDLKQAAAEWATIEKLLPHNSEPFYQAGRLLSKLDQWDAAEAALNEAVTLRPGLAEGWFELGCVKLATKRIEAALKNLNHARELVPQNATFCAYAGKALAKLDRHAEAMEKYHRAIQLQPGLWEAHFALGDELSAASRFSEAEAEYTEVTRLRPAKAVAHFDRGVMLARLSRYDEALVEFQETLRLEPGNRQAQEYLARVAEWQSQRHN